MLEDKTPGQKPPNRESYPLFTHPLEANDTRHSSLHRGDFKRVRGSINVALIELESLEPRMQLAYKHGEFPASAAADISLARLMVEELDGLLRGALDRAIGDTGKYHDIYADASYDRRQLVKETTT